MWKASSNQRFLWYSVLSFSGLLSEGGLTACSVECEENGALSDIVDRKVYKYALLGEGDGINAAFKELSVKGNQKNEIFRINPLSTDESQQIDQLDLHSKRIIFKNGKTIRYEKCLIDLISPPATLPKKHYDEKLLNYDPPIILEINDKQHLQHAIRLVEDGKHITIIGGLSWEMISYAATLAKHGQSHRNPRPVTLVFPSYGPLAHLLPRYFSQVIHKRLTSIGVEVIPYSNIRYIATSSSDLSSETERTTHEDKVNTSPEVTIYLAKTYDSLNTTSFVTNGLFFQPQPLTSFPLPSQTAVTTDDRLSSYRFLFNHKELELHPFTGGIMVNGSLEVLKDVAIIGPLASHPYHFTTAQSSQSYRHNCINCHHYYKQMGRFIGQLWENREDKKMFFNALPVNYMISKEMNFGLITIGHCSSHLDSHTFSVKQPLSSSSSLSSKSSRSLLNCLNITFFLQGQMIVGIVISGRLASLSSQSSSNNKKKEKSNRNDNNLEEELEKIWYSCIGHDITPLIPPPVTPDTTTFPTSITTPITMITDPLSMRLKQIQEMEGLCQRLLTHLLSSSACADIREMFEFPVSTSIGSVWFHRYHPAAKMSFYDFQDRVMKDYYLRQGGGGMTSEPIFHSMTRLGSKADQLQRAYSRVIFPPPPPPPSSSQSLE